MDNEISNVIRVGSRKSELALNQTNFVINSLKKSYPDREFTIVTMSTLGDRILDVSLPKIGEKSLFTKDLEDALRQNTLDFVVHSLKDLPTTLPDGLAIGAVFERDDPRDALVLRTDVKDATLSSLPVGSVIGTSSLRRTAQLRGSYPHLTVSDVRGNLNTRLRKLDSPTRDYTALLLAHAGLQRMGWGNRVSKVLPCAAVMYAVGQGALAVECRTDNREILEMLAPFNHPETYCRILAERSFLKTLGGGCSAPVGVSTTLKPLNSNFELTITGGVWSLDGTTAIKHTIGKTFAQIKQTQKHKLSPDEEAGSTKKIKVGDAKNDNLTPDEDSLDINDVANNINTNIQGIDDSKPRIFCGLVSNPNIPNNVIVDCDGLGQELANVLISKGALEVMKVTQDLIRNSIVTKS